MHYKGKIQAFETFLGPFWTVPELLIVIFMKMHYTCEKGKKHTDTTFPISKYIEWSVGMRGPVPDSMKYMRMIHYKLATLSQETKANVAWQALSLNVACRATKFAILH